jgi:hypothetical protein
VPAVTAAATALMMIFFIFWLHLYKEIATGNFTLRSGGFPLADLTNLRTTDDLSRQGISVENRWSESDLE